MCAKTGKVRLGGDVEAGDEALSSQVNEAVRFELDRRRQHRLLVDMLDLPDTTHGPVDGKLVDKYLDLLV